MYLNIKIQQLLFPSVIYKLRTNKIYLTFDDAPHPEATLTSLDILNKYNVKATFFVSGNEAEKYPSLLKIIFNDNHQLGNHAYSHKSLFFMNKDFIQKEINTTNEIIKSITGFLPILFRPPYGYLNWTILDVLQEYSMTCILWSIDSRDFKLSSKNIIKKVLISTAQGSIILFHTNDYTKNKINMYLPLILESLLEKGYEFDTIKL